MQFYEREALARQMFDEADVIDKTIIEQVHKATGIRTDDLYVAFHGTNEPFYTDTPANRRDAEWFAGYYHSRNWGTTHIRRCHYQLLSLQAPKPNGNVYRMEDDDWLYSIAKVARRLHLIPIEALEDHRNDEPLLFVPNKTPPKVATYSSIDRLELKLPDMPLQPSIHVWQSEDNRWTTYATHNFQGIQRYSLVLMCEKTTMNDILEPLARRYGMYLQTAAGEMSLYRIHQIAKWIKAQRKPAIVIYVSDFDKSGNGMPVTVGNNLAWCLQELGVRHEDIPVQLLPLVLTNEQVEQHQLPRMPVKVTMEDRMGGFEKAHGVKLVTELDALEALHPGVLRKILVEAIEHYYDTDLARQEQERVREIEKELTRIQHEIDDTPIDELVAQQAQERKERWGDDADLEELTDVESPDDLEQEYEDWQKEAQTWLVLSPV